MKTLIFIFYYLNVNGMSRQNASNLFETLIERTNLSYLNNSEIEIIQQYIPITEGETRVELHHVPNKVSIADSKEAAKINRSLQMLNENIKNNNSPIQTISDLYE